MSELIFCQKSSLDIFISWQPDNLSSQSQNFVVRESSSFESFLRGALGTFKDEEDKEKEETQTKSAFDSIHQRGWFRNQWPCGGAHNALAEPVLTQPI